MKEFVLSVFLILSCEAQSVWAQIVLPIKQYAVGSNSLIGGANDTTDAICGNVENVSVSNSDPTNFAASFFPRFGSPAGFYGYISFAPKGPGVYYDTVGVKPRYVYYSSCNSNPAISYINVCIALSDSGFYFTPGVEGLFLNPDTINRVVKNTGNIHFANWLTDTLWIDSISYLFPKSNAFISVQIDSSIIERGIPRLLPGNTYGTLPILFATNEGPGIRDTCALVFSVHSKTYSSIDTEYIIFNSDPIIPQVNIDPSSLNLTIPSSGVLDTIIRFVLNKSELVDSIWVSGYSPQISILSERDSAGTKVIHLQFKMTEEGITQGNIQFTYIQHLFNGAQTKSRTFIVDVQLEYNKADVKAETSDPSLKLAQNPFTNVITITCSCKKPKAMSVNLFDITGRIVRSIERECSEGPNEITIDGSSLPVGPYWYVARAGEWMRSGKLVKIE